MTLRLNEPLHWWRRGRMRFVTQQHIHELSPYDAALLLCLNRAGMALIPQVGEFMNDDVSTSLTLVSAPASEPLSLAAAKTFLRIEHAADDDAITRAIAAARQHAEHFLRTALLPQVWDYKVANPCENTLVLPWGPAQSITSITATTIAGASSTVAASTYRLSVDGRKVIFSPLPSTAILTVRYSASIAATAADVPPMIVQGMLHHIAVMMETRDGNAPLPLQSIHCYQPYRRVSL